MQCDGPATGIDRTGTWPDGVRIVVANHQTAAVVGVTLLLSWTAWAVWHLPLFAVGLARNVSGSVPLYAVLVVGLSVLLTWCYNGTGGSVLLAMLFHAGVNTAGGLLPVSEAAVARSPALIDAAMMVGVWLAVTAVVLRRDPATLSDGSLPGSERTDESAEATTPS